MKRSVPRWLYELRGGCLPDRAPFGFERSRCFEISFEAAERVLRLQASGEYPPDVWGVMPSGRRARLVRADDLRDFQTVEALAGEIYGRRRDLALDAEQRARERLRA